MTNDGNESARERALDQFLHYFADGDDLSGIPESLLPHLAEKLIPVARAALDRAATEEDASASSQGVRYGRRILEVTPDNSLDFLARKATLAFALSYDGRIKGSLDRLDEAITMHREVAAASAVGTDGWAQTLLGLAETLTERARLGGDEADL